MHSAAQKILIGILVRPPQAVGFNAPCLQVKRLVRVLREALQARDHIVRHFFGRGRRIIGRQPAPRRTSVGLVNYACARRRVPGGGENLAKVSLVWVQFPGKLRMRQAHHAIVVGIATGKD